MVISIVATCLLAWNPLASAGNEHGMWFVGDQDPTVLNFDSKTKGLEYSICARVSIDTYTNLQKLGHRPIDVAVYKDAIWFVDYATSIALYSIPKSDTTAPNNLGKATLQGILETEAVPTDLVSFTNWIAVGCGGKSLQVHTFDGYDWKQYATLDVPNARIANHNGKLIAVTPHEFGATVWTYFEDEWSEGNIVKLQGAFYGVLTKKDWLLLVSNEKEKSHLVGLQGTNSIEIASFEIPKGNWSVLSSAEGVSVLGVERNGTTTVLDIGWPSGKTHEWMVLQHKEPTGLSFIDRFPCFIPATIVILLFLLMSRKSKAKAKKTKN